MTNYTPENLIYLAQKEGWSVGPLKKGKFKGIPYEEGGGISINAPGARTDYIQYHPGGGHHGKDAYYKVSSGRYGKVRYNTKGELIQ